MWGFGWSGLGEGWGRRSDGVVEVVRDVIPLIEKMRK